MPQLMPMMWSMSTFMLFFIMLMLVEMYLYKNWTMLMSMNDNTNYSVKLKW